MTRWSPPPVDPSPYRADPYTTLRDSNPARIRRSGAMCETTRSDHVVQAQLSTAVDGPRSSSRVMRRPRRPPATSQRHHRDRTCASARPMTNTATSSWRSRARCSSQRAMSYDARWGRAPQRSFGRGARRGARRSCNAPRRRHSDWCPYERPSHQHRLAQTLSRNDGEQTGAPPPLIDDDVQSWAGEERPGRTSRRTHRREREPGLTIAPTRRDGAPRSARTGTNARERARRARRPRRARPDR
jgi:hypothetical protein